MSGADGTVEHKTHRERNAGRKATKKKAKKEHVQELTDKQRNPKAFTFNSAVRAERRFRRKQDIETKKHHIPVVDRTPVEPPPVLVVVVGPPKVGKSLVIQCLIKNFVKQPLSSILGPVTVVSSKKQRITFMECNNDINSMIDIAKVADLVLLLIDASFGFEMEIFEFLNICQVHGMPKIMGVLTHLDLIKNAKQMRKTKKLLKHRFWTEVYAGAKLFYLSGLLHDEYLRMEIKNLARFISVMKFRPLTWRTTHPYILADRVEDLTPPELIRQNPKVDRTISLYGYVRGTPLRKDTSIHIPGCGDMKIKDVSFLPDPCPLPEQIKKRALVEKERLIYAPFSGVGGIVYDKDAVYVELGGSHSYKQEDMGLAGALMDTQETLDQKLQRSELQLFSDAAPIKSQDVVETMAPYTSELVMDKGRNRRKVIFNDEKSVDDLGDNQGKNEVEDEEDDNDSNSEDDDNENDDDDNDSDSDDDNDEDNDDDDDDDDNDESNDEIPELDEKSIKKRKRAGKNDAQSKKKKISINTEEENDRMNFDETRLMKHKKKILQTNTAEVYHSLSKESDILIKNKISEALKSLEATKKKTKQDDDDESFDELRDEDTREELEMDDRASDLAEEDLDDEEEDDEEGEEDDKEKERKNTSEENSEADESEEVADELKWKVNLAEKAKDAFFNRQRSNKNLMLLVYGGLDKKKVEETKKEDETKSRKDIDALLHIIQEDQEQKIQERELQEREESVFFSKESPRDWLKDENKALLVNRFVTGKWKESEDAEELLKLDDMDDDDEEMYGDFEDLETGQKFKGTKKAPEELLADETNEKKKLMERKKKLKEQFNAEYDDWESSKVYYDLVKAEADKQGSINRAAFDVLDDDIRVHLEGYRPGMYVRVEIETVPCELIMHLDPTYPLIIGGLLHGEENIGYVQTRIKKHRWHSRILKSDDPLIFSVGWRRFQTLPIFSKLEDNLSLRMLKYTPEHMACIGHLWGPITPQGTGVLAVQDVASKESNFRIAATGSVVEMDKSTHVMKKLKLIGTPLKIYRKTAFIKDMFNSALEVAKFEGAKIKTVSGIRGQVKKAASKPEGCFRATFEDKIQMSDIVFCRTWIKIDVHRFYNPVTSLLLPPSEKNEWRGMKTTGQLRRERNIHAEANRDSMYTEVHRDVKVFKPLYIPRKLQKELPYRDKPKPASLPHRNPKFGKGRVAVVRDREEQRTAHMLRMIRVMKAYKEQKTKEAMTKRITEYQERVAAEEAKKMKKQREMKKEVFRDLSKLEKKKKR